MEEDWESWVGTVRQLVLSSNSRLTVQEISRKAKLLRGREIPFEKFQYKSLAEMLNRIPNMIVIEKNGQFYVMVEADTRALHVAETSKISSLEETLKFIQQKYTQTKSSSSEVDKNAPMTKARDENSKSQTRDDVPVTKSSDENIKSRTQDDKLKNFDTNKSKNLKLVTGLSDKSQTLNDAARFLDTLNKSDGCTLKDKLKSMQIDNGKNCSNSTGHAHVPTANSDSCSLEDKFKIDNVKICSNPTRCPPLLPTPSNVPVDTANNSDGCTLEDKFKIDNVKNCSNPTRCPPLLPTPSNAPVDTANSSDGCTLEDKFKIDNGKNCSNPTRRPPLFPTPSNVPVDTANNSDACTLEDKLKTMQIDNGKNCSSPTRRPPLFPTPNIGDVPLISLQERIQRHRLNQNVTSGRPIHGQNYSTVQHVPTFNVPPQQQNFHGIAQNAPAFNVPQQQQNYQGFLWPYQNCNPSAPNFTTPVQQHTFNTSQNSNVFFRPPPQSNQNQSFLSTLSPQNQNNYQDMIAYLSSQQQSLVQKTQGQNTQANAATAQDPQTANLKPDDPRLHLQCYAKARNIPMPKYKHLPALDAIYALVMIDSKKYSSYPHHTQSKDEAEKIAASFALEDLLGKAITRNFIAQLQEQLLRLQNYQLQNLVSYNTAYTDPLLNYYYMLYLTLYHYSVWYYYNC